MNDDITRTHADQVPADVGSGATRSARRTGLAIGLSAGLLGGAAAGLVFGVPGLTSAAGDTAVAVLAQTDETDTTGTDDTTRPEPGERLRESLQELVDDGTISAEQADAVAAHLVEQGAERLGERRGGHGHGRFDGETSDAVLELLGIDAETLRDELRGGATLAEVAEAQGVSVDELVAVMVTEAEQRIDEAVENGRIDADRAEEMKAELTERITERIENGPRRGPRADVDETTGTDD